MERSRNVEDLHHLRLMGPAARAGAGAGVEGSGGGVGAGPQDAERQHGPGRVVGAGRRWPWSAGCWPRGTKRPPGAARRCRRWRAGWTGWSSGLVSWRRRWAGPWPRSSGLRRETAGVMPGARPGSCSGWSGGWTGWSPAGGAGPTRRRQASRAVSLRASAAERRRYSNLVTVVPAGDDEQVFGQAWPLVEEWRTLWQSHSDQGRGLRWLTAEVRILELELAMLEEHGLTLPPETEPLRGLARNAQLGWRRKALAHTRRKLARRRARRWLRRGITLGLWWR